MSETIQCPNCYGGHFRPCPTCGDSGTVEWQCGGYKEHVKMIEENHALKKDLNHAIQMRDVERNESKTESVKLNEENAALKKQVEKQETLLSFYRLGDSRKHIQSLESELKEYREDLEWLNESRDVWSMSRTQSSSGYRGWLIHDVSIMCLGKGSTPLEAIRVARSSSLDKSNNT